MSIQIPISTEVQNLKLYLDNRGIKYKFITDHLGFTPAWATRLFLGYFELTQENQKRIEELLEISLSAQEQPESSTT